MDENDTPAKGDQSETPTTPQPNPREEAMAAIERQNNERIAKELGLKPEDIAASDDTDIDSDANDAEAEAERKRLEREADAAERQKQLDKQLDEGKDSSKDASKPEPTVLENFDNLMVKTKVDGHEVMRPLAELVRMDQKEAVINNRLREAAQLRQEAQRLFAEAKQGKTPTEPTTAPPSEGGATGKEFLDAIYAGEEDKALQAFEKLFGKGRETATPDPTAIARQVKKQLDTDIALDSFGTQYPDIIADPYLADIADHFLSAEIETGTPLKDALKKAGDSTRDWVKQKVGIVAPATPPTSRDDKRARKEAIDVIPSIHATATTSREPREPSVSEVLDEMRKGRGLAY